MNMKCGWGNGGVGGVGDVFSYVVLTSAMRPGSLVGSVSHRTNNSSAFNDVAVLLLASSSTRALLTASPGIVGGCSRVRSPSRAALYGVN